MVNLLRPIMIKATGFSRLPVNLQFLLIFAFDCVGVKIKNPETEAISGFCCNLLFYSAEKEGFEPPDPW